MMSAAATTAPKRLLTRSTWRSIGPASEMSALTVASPSSVAAPLRPQRADAARQEADHEQQEHAERQLPGVREVRARERADDLEYRAGDEHRGHALPAGENGDEDKLARGRPEAEVRLDVAEREDDERAAEAGAERGDDEVDRHRVACRAAEVLDAQLVLAHRERHQAARAFEEDPHRNGGDGRDEDRQQVERVADAVVGELLAKEGRSADVEAVGAAERVELHQEAVRHHRERQRQHREEDAAIARKKRRER